MYIYIYEVVKEVRVGVTERGVALRMNGEDQEGEGSQLLFADYWRRRVREKKLKVNVEKSKVLKFTLSG